MAAPVVVSRIQNRRGTQSQFETLYPGEYTSAPGATSVGTVVTVSSTAGLYENAKPQVSAGVGLFAPGTKVLSVNSLTEFTVNLPPSIPLSGGAQVTVPKYNGNGGVPIADYPNILLPGELALCVDTRRTFIGNLNGEYIELETVNSEGIFLGPLVISLPPSPLSYTVIPELSLSPTAFFTFLYSISDSTSPDWNDVGSTGFSKNGSMKITAVENFTPVPNLPFPPNTAVSLVDDSSEAKNTQPPFGYAAENISFKAEYNGAFIDISYMHDFPTALTFSTSTIRWLPF